MTGGRDKVLAALRRALAGEAASDAGIGPEPFPAPRAAADPHLEMDRLLAEVQALSGVTARLAAAEIDAALSHLVAEQTVRRATLWQTPRLRALGIEQRLGALGVDIVSPHSDKRTLAECDLGVTEVDFALPETGTLALLSSPTKPRAVSLVPRVHLAILGAAALRADLHQVFAEARQASYLVFITGPSRTADIELVVTLGVHGPQALFVWAMS